MAAAAPTAPEGQRIAPSSQPTRRRFGRSSSTHRHAETSNTNTTGDAESAAGGSRGSRLFRRLTLRSSRSSASVPSLPPSLILDLDAGTAASSTAPRSPAVPTPQRDLARTIGSDKTTAAAAVIAEAKAAATASPLQYSHKQSPQQSRKVIDAMAKARLDVHQTRELVRMCGPQIRERGLDSVGLFRPFRIVESQQRVSYMIQLFLLSIDISTYVAVFPILPENALDRLGGQPLSASSPDLVAKQKCKLARDELDKELRYASPHEVVSMLKWGLRHMRLRCSDFHSKDADEWYNAFVAAERAAGYHPRAITNLLHPRLPQETAEMLSELLELMASVAAHVTTNHMSASTLCKVLGFWMFGRIGVAHPPPSVDELLLATDKCARMAQHLLLAHIRSQAAVTYAMPLRLTELVDNYPCVQPGEQSPSLPAAFTSRSISALRIDMRSENLVVSQTKPRTPSATLAAALDATASNSLQGDKGEVWAAIIGHHYDSQNRKPDPAHAKAAIEGDDLLVEEHARILRLVESELDSRKASEQETEQNHREASVTGRHRSASSVTSEKPPRLPSLSLASTAANVGEQRRDDNDESMEVVADEKPSSVPSKNVDLFTGVMEPSASWRSFSEDGFGESGGLVSTASSELSLSDRVDVPPSAHTLPAKTSPNRRRTLQRVKSTSSSLFASSSAGRPSLTHAFTAPSLVEQARTVVSTVTAARLVPLDTAVCIMWQDQLLDLSPCCSLPCFVLVQLNALTSHAIDTSLPQGMDSEPWLLLVESILPPRPPTPPPSPTRKQSRWDSQSYLSSSGGADRKSILAPSLRSVKSTLRRVSTIIGRSKSRKHTQHPSHDSDKGSIFPSF